MKKCIKFLFIVLILLLLSLYLFIACSNHGAKNYAYSRNSEAEQTYKYLCSNESLFDKYCESYGIPKLGTIFLSGITNNKMNFFVESNEYCPNQESISINSDVASQVYYYWTVKIVDNNIMEIWVYSVPLKQNQLKPYTLKEQINMIPLFNNNKNFKYKSEYVIGYFHA